MEIQHRGPKTSEDKTKSISYRVAPVPLKTYSSLNIMRLIKKYLNAPRWKKTGEGGTRL